MSTTSVRVELPIGDYTCAMAVCDVFTAGELTVNSADPEWADRYGPMRVFPKGTWLRATTYEHGYPLHSYTPESPMQQQEVA